MRGSRASDDQGGDGGATCLRNVDDHFDFDKTSRGFGGVGRSDLGGAGGEYRADSWEKKGFNNVQFKKLVGGG